MKPYPSIRIYIITVLIALMGAPSAQAKHLFILSGQSNMARLDPSISFTPTVEAAFEASNVIVVKDAKGGQPIQMWYDVDSGETGELYKRLMKKVEGAVAGQPLSSVSFLWMQGERNAKVGDGAKYEQGLRMLMDKVKADLGIDAMNFVIGRLSDAGINSNGTPDWNMIREIQVSLADSSPRGAWVDTDDLNDGVNAKGKAISNDLHYSVEGYKVFGQRLAEAAIALIEQNAK
ncbi:MAG: sialate O-acetylesterase [Opitutales bacterium]